jgi:RNA polymerase sigma factor (sigma-70 family)
MPSSQAKAVLRYIRKVAAAQYPLNLADQELLERFTGRSDEAAFAALVHRHGPMVLHLCRRVLRNNEAAEDAFQATFLVFCQKAASLRMQESVGGWLHSVAYRIAQKARIAAARRRKHEGRLSERQVTNPLVELTLREAHEILDQELVRLPEKFRVPLVLCYLEGLTKDEAAQQLGWPASTVKSRLEQARERLRGRLTSRGLALSGALVASLFHEATASAAVPPVLLDSTIKAASLFAAGQAVSSVVSTKVTALSEGVLKTMSLTKLKIAIAVTLLGVGLSTTVGVTYRAWAAEQPQATDPRAGADPQEKGKPEGKAAEQAPEERQGEAAKEVTVQGRVLDPDGKPFRGAKLYLWTSALKKESDMAERARTGEDGRFRFTAAKSEVEGGRRSWRLPKGMPPTGKDSESPTGRAK